MHSTIKVFHTKMQFMSGYILMVYVAKHFLLREELSMSAPKQESKLLKFFKKPYALVRPGTEVTTLF